MTRRVLVPVLAAPPALPSAGSTVNELAGDTMGSTWSVKLAAAPGFPLARLAAGIQAQLDQVVRQMSTWEPDSDISRYNRAPPGTWHTLPPQFFHVLATALDIAGDTDGAYDPAAGALVNLWGFGPAGRVSAPPDENAIAQARARSGWARLQLDRPNCRALQPGGLQLDLSSIAKGFGVDEVARTLEGAGLKHWLIEVGGELRGAGTKPGGEPWWVTLESPPGADALPDTLLALHGLAVATSGDYRQGFTHAGVRYSHTLDPRTGRPLANALAAVAVLHRQCMLADAHATALMVLGPAAGMAYAQRLDLAARFVVRGGDGFAEQVTPAFAAMAEG